MGYYINKDSKGNLLPVSGKADALLEAGDARQSILPINSFSDIAPNEALLCAVDNGMFDAVAYAFCEGELKHFQQPDGRDKRWLLMNKQLAEKLSNYKK